MKKNYTKTSFLFALLFSFSCFAKTNILTILPPITATAIVTQQVSCAGGNNGSVTIQATGGTGIFTYLLSVNGIILSPYQSSNIFTGLQSGQYDYLVKDSANTVFNGTFVVTQPTPLVCSTSVSGSTITTIVNGGSAPYIFSLSNSLNNLIINSFTTGIFSNVSPEIGRAHV